jgi:hypothetical protein
MFQHLTCKEHPALVLSRCEGCRRLVAASPHPKLLVFAEEIHHCPSPPAQRKEPQNAQSFGKQQLGRRSSGTE